jgi:hypothetical protein
MYLSIRHSRIVVLILSLVVMLGAYTAFAQDSASADGVNTPFNVTFGPLSFAYPEAVGRNLNIVQYPGDEPNDQMAGALQPKHTAFMLYNDLPAAETPISAPAGIYLYNTADFEGFTEFQNRLSQLQTILGERPDLAQYEQYGEDLNTLMLPFLPVVTHGQVIRAKTAYVENETVSGISYIAAFKAAAEPFIASEFLYTFQGISADGQYYVSVVVNLNAGMFPQDFQPIDPEAFFDRLAEYMNESIDLLNAGAAEDFTPSLTAVEAMVQSIRLDVTQ